MNATDPSGFIFKKIHNALKDFRRDTIRGAVKIFGADFVNFVGSIVASYFGGPIGAAAWSYEFSRAMGASSSAALRGAMTSLASAVIFSYVGDKFSASEGFFQTGGVGHIMTHAVVGGVMAELQGGKFGHGFVSAGLTKAFMHHSGFDYSDGSAEAVIGRTIVAGIVGGTISEMTGGKFANGAITAAMAHLFNKELSEAQKRSNYVKIIEGFKELSKALSVNPKDAVGSMTPDQFRAYFAVAYGVDLTDPLVIEYYKTTEYNMLGQKTALQQFQYFHQIVGATANEIGDYVLDSFTLRMAKFAGVPPWVIKQYEQYQKLQDWKDLQDDVEEINHK